MRIFWAGLLVALPLLAHHSISGDYFMDQRTTVEGEVVQFQYRNPHSFVEIKTASSVVYSAEWNGAGRLGRNNINADTLKPGDHIVITGQPGRNADEHRMHVLKMERPADGWNWNRQQQKY